MPKIRTQARLAAVLTAGALASGAALSAAPAHAAPAHAAPGTTSLAKVLAADGNKLDRNWNDFDIADKAVHAVLKAKPMSPVAVLADGKTRLTAFIPTDRAFRRLATDLTGHRKATERGVLRAVTKVANTDTLEKILLYHVVPGATITYRQARHSDGAKLTTALGPKITVNVVGHVVRLKDRDPDDRNPRIIRSLTDINKGNKQIAHGINRVLRPVNL
jgi:uncharacterized surface protein with fasciclin (FAS1) repeats